MYEKKPLTDDEVKAILSGSNVRATAPKRQLTELDIALAAEENHDEFLRIRTEDVARGKAVEQARRDRGQREKVLTEKRRIASGREEAT
jgi:hypothetical protein